MSLEDYLFSFLASKSSHLSIEIPLAAMSVDLLVLLDSKTDSLIFQFYSFSPCTSVSTNKGDNIPLAFSVLLLNTSI